MTESALFCGQLFNGISVASILLLAALGSRPEFWSDARHQYGAWRDSDDGRVSHLLDITGSAARPSAYLLGMLVAFVGTALFGALLEMTLIRRLYGRPLDTLLATWGVSLIMQQGARSIFGPIGDEVTAPSWLSGSIHDRCICGLRPADWYACSSSRYRSAGAGRRGPAHRADSCRPAGAGGPSGP